MDVVTTSGPVRGRKTKHGSAFHAIPYAAPPTGARRFAAPAPHDPWTEVRDATRPGSTAPQPARDAFGALDMSAYFAPGWRKGPDHLTLDIHTPNRTPAPVLVFVHGGGFVAGSASAPLYDGTTFARDGVVLVTVEYRLGIPGFLHLPDAPDNRGLLDVLAALRWIRDNIARFGGDPDTVTLFGQSAGSILVSGVLADPASKGLVRRAITQSGTGANAFTTEQARIVTEAAGRALGVAPTAAALARVSDEALVDVLHSLTGLDLRTPTHPDPLGGITALSLVLDEPPSVPPDVDLLIGSNVDEGGLYLAPLGKVETTTDTDVLDQAARFHPRPAEVVRAYRDALPDASPGQLRVAILGDGLFRAGTRRAAAAHAEAGGTTFAYEFAWRPDTLDGLLGACHAMELPFVFDHVDLPSLHGPNGLLGTTPPPADLAERTHRAWVDFATTGDPGWPRHTPDHRAVRRIDEVWETVVDPRAVNPCDARPP